MVQYQNVRPGLCILYYQHSAGDDVAKLPPFVPVEKDVTNEPEFGSYEMSIHGKEGVEKSE